MIRPLALASSLLCSIAGADPLPARETAHVGEAGQYSVGIFAPLTYAVAEGLELRGHPLLFLVSPNLVVRHRHLQTQRWTLAGEYGLSVPTPLLELSQGYLLPSWDRSDDTVGWIVVPRAGLVASRGSLQQGVLTFFADVAVGIPLTRNDAEPLDAPAPLEMLLAPALHGYRGRVGAAYDHPFTERLRGRLYADGFVHQARPSPLTLRGGVNLDLGVGRQSRLTLGVVWWNADQHAIDPATGRRHRSNDFLPTLDFIWAG
jgi:hypothetical protein